MLQQPIDITVDRYIWLTTTHISDFVIRDILAIMTVPNREKLAAKQQHLWGADKLDDHITLYKWLDERTLILPRGFYLRLTQGLKWLDYELNIVNHMTNERALNLEREPNFTLRDYQRDALGDLEYYAQGIYQAPTGSGKTVAMLASIADLRQRSLVIVNKKELVQQWVDRSQEFLGYTPGFIGDGKWDEKEFTIAMQQTLWAKRDEIDEEFWNKWGMVVLDECHSVQADTYHQIMQRFPAMYRIGVSATPKKTGDFKICEAVMGPIIHTTPKKPLREKGYLITPKVYTIATPFNYPFYPNVIGINKIGKKYVKKQNNWKDVISKLIVDVPRNTLIANIAQSLQGRVVLILSKRLEHLEQLRQLLGDKREVLLLTGAESLSERMNVYERASRGNCIILSTLADEGVDIPRIDAVFLAFPMKNISGIRQLIGRGERPHPDKKDFIIVDFVDFSIRPIKQQYRDRKNFLYRPEEIEVEKIDPLQFLSAN